MITEDAQGLPIDDIQTKEDEPKVVEVVAQESPVAEEKIPATTTNEEL